MTVTLLAALKREAEALGFDALAVTTADAIPDAGARLQAFLGEGRHGEMDWLARAADRRMSPKGLWPDVKSVIMLAMNYAPAHDPLAVLGEPARPAISVYAQGRDYHDVIKGRLKQLARWLVAHAGGDVKVFVDTAAVMEKPLAAAAGLGWQGKHTNLVSREFGSWLFLGAIFTTLELERAAPEPDHCGACRACLDVCPTNAFPAPYQLDARRCISYLTIEHKGPIPHEFRAAIGNRIYGCDDCLAVCPWNKFAKTAHEAAFHPRAALAGARLSTLAALDDAAFRQLFSGSPIKRIGRDRFVRNVAIALGNQGDAAARDALGPLLGDQSALVRGAAVWAFARAAAPEMFAKARAAHEPREDDETVRAEWRLTPRDAQTA